MRKLFEIGVDYRTFLWNDNISLDISKRLVDYEFENIEVSY